MGRELYTIIHRRIVRRCKEQINECNQIIRDIEYLKAAYPNAQIEPDQFAALGEQWQKALLTVTRGAS